MSFTSSINSIGATVRQPAATPVAAATAAKRSFFDKPVTSLGRSVTSELSQLKARFSKALGRDGTPSATTILEGAVRKAHTELSRIDELYTEAGYAKKPGATLPNNPDAAAIKELRSRLSAVANTEGFTKAAPLNGLSAEKTAKLKGLIERNRHDPMFKLMGPSKFLGYALKSEENLAKADPIIQQCAARMTTCEGVALFGYTCADYAMLNSALRNGKGSAGIDAYVSHATSAMRKCPPYTENAGVTRRAIKDPEGKPGWATNRYGNNSTVAELAFTSTGVLPAQSTYEMVVTGHGYDVSAFSAWPAETEVLYPPGTIFYITVSPDAPNVFHAQQVTTPDSGRL